MNERIKELAKEAYFLVENDKVFAPDAFDSIDVELQDFAELIIQECMDVVGSSRNGYAKLAKHFNLELNYELQK